VGAGAIHHRRRQDLRKPHIPAAQRDHGSRLRGSTTPQRFRQAIVQLDTREAGSDAGLAFVNADNSPVVVTLDLFKGPGSRRILVAGHAATESALCEAPVGDVPGFENQQGTLVIEAAPNRAVSCMALRLDGGRLTSIPVRPLGFSFAYSVTSDAGGTLETGFWMFDMVGFNLIGSGKIESPSPAELSEVTGSWIGTNFQFRYRKVFQDGTVGVVVFNGTSAGRESTAGADGKSKAVTGKVTTLGPDGRVISLNNFTAFQQIRLAAAAVAFGRAYRTLTSLLPTLSSRCRTRSPSESEWKPSGGSAWRTRFRYGGAPGI